MPYMPYCLTLLYVSDVIVRAHSVSLCIQWRSGALYLWAYQMLLCCIVDRTIMKSLEHSSYIRTAYDSIQ